MIKILIVLFSLLLAYSQGIFRTSNPLNSKTISTPSDNALSNNRQSQGGSSSSAHNHPSHRGLTSKRGSWVAEVTAGRNMLAKATASANKFSNGAGSSSSGNNNANSQSTSPTTGSSNKNPQAQLPPTSPSQVHHHQQQQQQRQNVQTGQTIPVTNEQVCIDPNQQAILMPQGYSNGQQQQQQPQQQQQQINPQQFIQQQMIPNQLQQAQLQPSNEVQVVPMTPMNPSIPQQQMMMQASFQQHPQYLNTPQPNQPYTPSVPQNQFPTSLPQQFYTPIQSFPPSNPNLGSQQMPMINNVVTSTPSASVPSQPQQPMMQMPMSSTPSVSNQMIQTPIISAQQVQNQQMQNYPQTPMTIPTSSIQPTMTGPQQISGNQQNFQDSPQISQQQQPPNSPQQISNNGNNFQNTNGNNNNDKWPQNLCNHGPMQTCSNCGYSDFPGQIQNRNHPQSPTDATTNQNYPSMPNQMSMPTMYQQQQSQQPQQPVVQQMYLPQQQGNHQMNMGHQMMMGGNHMGYGSRSINGNGAPQEKVPGEALRLLQGAVSFSFAKRQAMDYGFLPGEPLWSRVEGSSDLLPTSSGPPPPPPSNSNSNSGGGNGQPSNQGQGPRNFNNYNCIRMEFENSDFLRHILTQGFLPRSSRFESMLLANSKRWFYHLPSKLIKWNVLIEKIMKKLQELPDNLMTQFWWNGEFNDEENND